LPVNYLKHFPAPLLDDLVHNRWLPIVGAGFSRNADLPAPKRMPLWEELGRQLHKELPEYIYTNALDIISAYSHSYSKVRLIERLYSLLFIDEARPGKVHKAFCQVPFDIVCTTNFDFLLERQYQLISRPCMPILSEDQLSISLGETHERLSPRTALLKIHGDLNHPANLVVTEDDYDGYINSRPLLSTHIGDLLITRTAFLVGYSLDDSDLRQLWRIVSSRLGVLRRPAYALMVAAEPSVVSRYERRGLKIINIEAKKERYSEVLADVFQQLHLHWVKYTMPASVVIREEPLQELSLPSDVPSRLCFFAAPQNLLAYLRNILFPEISRAGFAPLLTQDVLSPGDNIAAKIEAMIARSSIAIIVMGSTWTAYEQTIALARLGTNHVLILKEAQMVDAEISSDVGQLRIVIFDPRNPDETPKWVNLVRSWLEEHAAALRQRFDIEPTRLFKKGEYKASLISAISHLEIWLRLSLRQMEYEIDPNAPIHRLLDVAVRRQIIDARQIEGIKRAVSIRNLAVHADRQVTKGEAHSALSLLADITRG